MSNLTREPDAPSTTTEAAKGVAKDTAEQARDVAQQAKAQAGSVVSEAQTQAEQVMSTATSELSTQLERRLGQASVTARDTASQLRAMAEGRPEEAGRTGELVRQAGEQLERLADRVDELGFKGVTEEITDFARRRPVAFLVGAAAAGLVAGRLVRAGREASSQDDQQREQYGPQGAVGTGDTAMIDLTASVPPPAIGTTPTAPAPSTLGAAPATVPGGAARDDDDLPWEMG